MKKFIPLSDNELEIVVGGVNQTVVNVAKGLGKGTGKLLLFAAKSIVNTAVVCVGVYCGLELFGRDILRYWQQLCNRNFRTQYSQYSQFTQNLRVEEILTPTPPSTPSSTYSYDQMDAGSIDWVIE